MTTDYRSKQTLSFCFYVNIRRPVVLSKPDTILSDTLFQNFSNVGKDESLIGFFTNRVKQLESSQRYVFQVTWGSRRLKKSHILILLKILIVVLTTWGLHYKPKITGSIYLILQYRRCFRVYHRIFGRLMFTTRDSAQSPVSTRQSPDLWCDV